MKLGRPKQQYDYRTMLNHGLYVTAYAFANYMGMPYHQVKNLIKAGHIQTHKGPDGKSRIPNPARNPLMRDAEWDGIHRRFITNIPSLRTEGLI